MLAVAADLRAKLEPVRDQGRRPTCLSFAASTAHRSAHRHSAELSTEWLYYHATRRDSLRPEQGSTIEATRAVILNDGQPDETFWPYQGRNACPTPYAPPDGQPSILCCGTGLRNGSADRWRTDLSAGIPVVITLFISPAFYNPADSVGPEAMVADDNAPIDDTLVHAVILAGYGDVKGTSYFLIRNSWGSRWGRAGYAWLPETYLTRRFAGAFVIQHGAADDVQPNAPSTYSRLRVG